MSESNGCIDKKTIIVMGNGPSLKNVDFSFFDGFDTIGMNAAYRYYYEINWWPTYFCCFDYVVTNSHTDAFKQMIENPKIPVKKFFLLKKISNSDKLEHVRFNKVKYSDWGNTGVNACQMGYLMRYRRFILIGIDCNYIEEIPGSVRRGGTLVEMEETPETNENYFFDHYQQKGDKFNIPNAHKFHLPAWEKFSCFAKENDLDVVNCGSKSTLDFFRKSDLKDELDRVQNSKEQDF